MPLATGTLRIFASEHTFKALRVVLSSDWLPATVVIASRSMSGWWAASRMAMASSWPGSQSRIILCFILFYLYTTAKVVPTKNSYHRATGLIMLLYGSMQRHSFQAKCFHVELAELPSNNTFRICH